MRYFLIVGEKSGDLHASHLCKAIRQLDPKAQIRGWGGDHMKQAGVDVTRSYAELAIMGLWEVIKNLNTIRGFLKEAQNQIEAFQPDILILVDYAGFNLRLAKWAKSKKMKVAYYIAPKAWAWKKNRVIKIQKYVDHLLVIFPFEVNFFSQFGIKTTYVGNPTLEEVTQFKANPNFLSETNPENRPIIALLPGSRKQELQAMADRMNDLSLQYCDYLWIMAGVDHLDPRLYQAINPKIKILFNQTYDILAHAHAAIVTSGTATLETALFQVPQAVVYKTSPLTYRAAKLLVKIKYISLVNLVAQKQVVKELIQKKYNIFELKKELDALINNQKYRTKILENYQQIKADLGQIQTADEAASAVYQLAIS